MQATAATTAYSTLTAHPNGTFTVDQSLAPVRKRMGGTWTKLDPTLRKNSHGTISPTVSTDELALSAGGKGPLATMVSDGRSLALTLPMALPTPTLSGPTATYANVLPDVDLSVTADAQGGFSEVLTVKNATAAANPALKTLTLATRSKGVKVTSDKAGNITASDRGGHPVFTAPAPTMWDSATDTHPSPAAVDDPITGQQVDRKTGQPLTSSKIGPGKSAHTANIAVRATNSAITLTPSASLLTGSHTVYPVYVDPTFTAPSASSPRQAWTQTNSYYSSSSYWKSSDLLRVGDQAWQSPNFVARSFVQVGVPSQVYGSTVLSSQINFTEEWSASCTATAVQLWQSSGISASTTWNNPPSLINQIGSQTVAHGWDSSCPAAGVGFDISGIMQQAANGHWGNLTFGLKAGDETDPYGWKEFANTISVATTYDHAPNTPTTLTTSPATSCADNTVVGDGSVTLYAGVSDPDGGTVGSHFQLSPHGNSSNIIASSDPNSLTNQSGSTAVYVIPKATLESAAGGKVTEFDWNVQVTDFKYTSSWSTTCHFSFDPTHPGAPVIAQPGNTTISQPVTVTINPPPNGTVPSSYEYQVNGGDPANVLADSSGNATITIKPTRHTNVLTVSSLSAGANYGDATNVTFNSAAPTTVQADGDLSGDGVPDLLAVGNQNGLPPGLWLADGKVDPGHTNGDGHVINAAIDIGAYGAGINANGANGAGSPSDYNGALAVTGHFTGTALQDVLVYYPSGNDAGGGVLLNGSGDGSALPSQHSENDHLLPTGSFQDLYTNNPTQLVNAGSTSGANSGYPDLIGISGDSTDGYTLNLYPSQGFLGGYNFPVTLNVNTPDGTADWNNWTIATMQLPASGGNSSTAMFLWKKSTGELDLWENLAADPNSGNLTYTAYPVATNWNTGAAITLQAADINGDGTPDLWTTGSGGAATANLFSNLSTTGAATLTQNTDTPSTANNTWPLNDHPTGTITTASDTTGSLNLTASGGATWTTGSLFSPAAHVDGTGVLNTSSAAVSTNADFTVSAWVKPEALGSTVLSQNGTHTSGFALYTDAATQTWRFEMPTSDTGSPTEDIAIGTGRTAQIGAWSHIAATYSASTGRTDLYVNGMDIANTTHTSAWNATGAFTIGAYLNNGSRAGYFQGSIADVKIYKQALAAPQISALANVPYIPAGTVIAQASGDFNGDGKADIAHLYNCGGGHMALVVALADANGDGGFGPSRLVWDDPNFGPGVKYMAAGDFNGDGKTDIALFYNYTDNNNSHVAIFTLTATGGGGFTAPTKVWDSTNFGPNTQFMSAGDFNGDGKADLALFYNYPDNNYQHDAIFTLTAHANGDGGFATPVGVWDNPSFGPNVKMMSAGDFNGDGKTDLALYYNYTDNNNQHDAIFTLTAHANGDGGFAAPASIWNDTSFGPNTKYMTTGDFNGDGKTDIALFYNYTDNGGWDVAIFTMNGTATTSPTTVWSNTNWGPNSEFLVSGDYNGDGKADLAFYYNYANQTPAVFTLTADANGDGGFASPVRRFSDQ